MTEELARNILLIGFFGWILLGFIGGIIVAFTEENPDKDIFVTCFWIGVGIIMGPITLIHLSCYYFMEFYKKYKENK